MPNFASAKTQFSMKILIKYLFIAVVLLVGCGKSGQHEHHDQEEESPINNPNQALYDQVMDIHNDVMPKSDEIYQLKKEIKDKMDNTKNLESDKKKQLEQIVAELDSADHSMMDWMHKFKPLPDSANQELAREYLENEMERIKTVRELINGSLQKAKEELEKK
jgi:hypothetical protein